MTEGARDEDTMSVLVLRALLGALTFMGRSNTALLEALGPYAERLGDPETRVPITLAHRIFAEAARVSGDEDIGLKAAEALPLGVLDVLDHATTASRTIGEGLSRMTRYYALLTEGITTVLETEGDEAKVAHWSRLPYTPPRSGTDMLFGTIVSRGRKLTGCEWPMRRVSMTYPRPASTAALEAFFRVPISFEQPTDELVFDRTFLDQPLLTADPRLSEMLERFAAGILAKLPESGPFLSSVRRAVAEGLAGSDPNAEATAQRLGTSVRTLQRKLHALGTSHQKLVDDVRRELATRYLADKQYGIREIGYLLGFSDGSTFHRAFRRWTGQTPKDYRRAATP